MIDHNSAAPGMDPAGGGRRQTDRRKAQLPFAGEDRRKGRAPLARRPPRQPPHRPEPL